MSLEVCWALYTACHELVDTVWPMFVKVATCGFYGFFIACLYDRYIEQPSASAHSHDTNLAKDDQAVSDTDPDVLACRYCRVNRIAVVYRPCGHALCCRACATHQQRCMYCCGDIGERVYMVFG